MGMRHLGTLAGTFFSSAYGINDAGQAVGFSEMATGAYHAFITGPNGAGMMDLNSLVHLHLPNGSILEGANAINNAGRWLSSLPSRSQRSMRCSSRAWL